MELFVQHRWDPGELGDRFRKILGGGGRVSELEVSERGGERNVGEIQVLFAHSRVLGEREETLGLAGFQCEEVDDE